MQSNLPPGITDKMISGNRSEDEEIEVVLYLSRGEIEALRQYNDMQQRIPEKLRSSIWWIVEDIVSQFSENNIAEE